MEQRVHLGSSFGLDCQAVVILVLLIFQTDGQWVGLIVHLRRCAETDAIALLWGLCIKGFDNSSHELVIVFRNIVVFSSIRISTNIFRCDNYALEALCSQNDARLLCPCHRDVIHNRGSRWLLKLLFLYLWQSLKLMLVRRHFRRGNGISVECCLIVSREENRQFSAHLRMIRSAARHGLRSDNIMGCIPRSHNFFIVLSIGVILIIILKHRFG